MRKAWWICLLCLFVPTLGAAEAVETDTDTLQETDDEFVRSFKAFPQIGFFYDGNPELQSSDANEDSTIKGDLGIDLRLLKDRKDRQYEWDFTIESSWAASLQGEENDEFLSRFSGSIDTNETRGRFFHGVQFAHTTLRVDGDGFYSSDRLTAAVASVSSRTQQSRYGKGALEGCELDRVIAYISYEDFDDREDLQDSMIATSVPVEVLNRDSKNWYAGVEIVRFVKVKGKNKNEEAELCRRTGLFRRLYLDDSINFELGYERQSLNTDGAEFKRDVDVLRFTGRRPYTKVVFDWALVASRARFADASVYDSPGDPRRYDERIELSLGLTRNDPVLNRSGKKRRFYRVGISFTRQDSIDEYDFTRIVAGITFTVPTGTKKRLGDEQNFISAVEPLTPGGTVSSDADRRTPRRPRRVSQQPPP